LGGNRWALLPFPDHFSKNLGDGDDGRVREFYLVFRGGEPGALGNQPPCLFGGGGEVPFVFHTPGGGRGTKKKRRFNLFYGPEAGRGAIGGSIGAKGKFLQTWGRRGRVRGQGGGVPGGWWDI